MQYSLSFVLVCASLLEPLHSRNCRRLWLWQLSFGVSLRVATSNLCLDPLPPTALSNRSVLHDGRKHKAIIFFYNPTLSANKHVVVQICRFSLSAAADGRAGQTVQVNVEPRLSTATQCAQSWNGIERSLTRAVVPQSLPVSATTFPTVLSLYIGHCRRDPCERISAIQAAELQLSFEKEKYINLVGSSCLKHANEMRLGDPRQADQRTQNLHFLIGPPLKRKVPCLYMLLWISLLQPAFWHQRVHSSTWVDRYLLVIQQITQSGSVRRTRRVDAQSR